MNQQKMKIMVLWDENKDEKQETWKRANNKVKWIRWDENKLSRVKTRKYSPIKEWYKLWNMRVK
jgi:hypothetical protein